MYDRMRCRHANNRNLIGQSRDGYARGFYPIQIFETSQGVAAILDFCRSQSLTLAFNLTLNWRQCGFAWTSLRLRRGLSCPPTTKTNQKENSKTKARQFAQWMHFR